jgi:uncharacterized membrane protein/predicted N-acetyltransferase YhbS
MLLFTGMGHFIRTEPMAAMLPPAVPGRVPIVLATGILEWLAAVGLLVPVTRRLTGMCLMAFLVAVFPANVYAALAQTGLGDHGPWYLLIRGPMQAFLILWTYLFAVRTPRGAPPPEWERDGFVVSTDLARLRFDDVWAFITRSYWAEGISRARLRGSMARSLCFGLYQGSAQIGFARVITDGERIAYLADVYVLEAYRGRGLGRWLVECVLAHPDLAGVGHWLLATRDAHALYRRFGFTPLPRPEIYMEKKRLPSPAHGETP